MKIDGWGRAYDSFSIKEFASIFWIYGSFIYVESDTANRGDHATIVFPKVSPIVVFTKRNDLASVQGHLN